MNDRRITPQLVLGLIVLLFGTALFLDRLDLIDAGRVIRLWPLIIVAFAGARLKTAQTTAETVGSVIWIGVGLLLFLNLQHIVRIGIPDLFPMGIMAFGGYLIWRAAAPARGRNDEGASVGSARLSGFAIMGGLQRRSNAQDYRRGDFTAIMGSCEVDLTQASIGTEDATIDVFTCMGGIEIRVPRDWTVTNKVFPFMGGAEDKTTPPPTQTKHLVVRGMAFLGGVEIKN